MSDSSESDEIMSTPPEILEKAQAATHNLLPLKSKERYEITYQKFMDWRHKHNVKSFLENVLLAYFEEISKTMKPSSLWAIYSMLRTTLNINNNINIANDPKLIALLNRKSDGFRSKKSKILSTEQINKFLKDAPGDKHLLSKVILIIGLSGACRKQELRNIKMEHIQDTGKSLIIDIPDTKTKTRRSFVVPETFYITCQKYMNLRPAEMELPLFVNYRNGKCIKQVVGINTIGNTPRKIAEYLELPEPKQYTGHCFRRSSATMLVDAGGDMLSLKRLGGWQSSTVAEGYVNESLKNKNDNALRISEAITNYQSSSSDVPSSTTIINNRSSPLNNKAQSIYNNCSIVINNYYNKV